MSAVPARPGRAAPWSDLLLVDPERSAAVVLDEIHKAELAHAKRRPRTMSARDALKVLRFEALLVLVAAGNVRNGIELSDDDMQRLAVAYARIDTIAAEAE